MIVFLDTEFTRFIGPELLSLGAVTLDGREHYVELDMETDVGQARLAQSSDFVRYDGVLDLFGLVPGAKATYLEMGRRTGEWLLQLARECGSRLEVAFDYATDYELLQYAIDDSGLWDQVRKILVARPVGALTDSPEGQIAAEACFETMRPKGLTRHHALADAHALRAAYVACQRAASPARVRLPRS